MAENNIKLPKRLYYRLSEAVEYLIKNGFECSEMDLLHLGATGQLEMMAKFPDDIEGSFVSYYTLYESDKENGYRGLGGVDKKIETGFIESYFGCDFVSCGASSIFSLEINGSVEIGRVSALFTLIYGTDIIHREQPLNGLEEILNYRNDEYRSYDEKTRLYRFYEEHYCYYLVHDHHNDAEDTFVDENKINFTITKDDIFILNDEVQRLLRGDELPFDENMLYAEKIIKSNFRDKDLSLTQNVHPRTQNNYLKTIAALKLALKGRGVNDTEIANIITQNSQLLGEPVAQSTAYKIIADAKKQQK